MFDDIISSEYKSISDYFNSIGEVNDFLIDANTFISDNKFSVNSTNVEILFQDLNYRYQCYKEYHAYDYIFDKEAILEFVFYKWIKSEYVL